MSRAPTLPPQQVWFAINVSKAMDKNMERDEWIKHIHSEALKGIQDGIPWNLNTLNFLMLQNTAYGPFTTKSHAIAMAPAELDEESKDLWKEEIWTTILIPNVFEEEDLEYPDWSLCTIRYVCKTCGFAQIFKGSCGKCKAEGKPYTPTIKVRDWDGELS